MTALTIIAIILALFLGMAIVVAVRNYYRADSLLRKNKAQQIEINGYREANIDPNSTYHVMRVNTDSPEFDNYNGCWGVCRYNTKRGRIIATTIKVFTDEDNDFNQREAEELCEMLNS